VRKILVAILFAAFWAGVWAELDDSLLTRVLRLDEQFYMERAVEVTAGEVLPEHGFYRSPIYPYLVAMTASARGMDEGGVLLEGYPWPLRLMQALLWAATAGVIWRIARRRLEGWYAWIPVLLFLLYRPAAVFVNAVLVEIPLVFCLVALIELVDSARGWSLRRAALAGLLLGLGTLLRGHVLVLGALVAWSILRSGAQRWTPLAVVCGLVVLLLVPAAAHNSRTAGQLAGPNLNGGINLLIGNGPNADGFFNTIEGHDFFNDVSGERLLTEELGRPVTSAVEADRIWRQRAVDAIDEDPARTAGLWFKKVWLHLVNPEISSITPIELWPGESRLLHLLFVPWGVIAALGCAGLMVGARRAPNWALALLILLAVQSVFFVTTRYRMALLPIFTLFAGAFVMELARATGRRRFLLVGVLLACGLATVPWGLERPIANLRTAGLAHAGVSALALGQHRVSAGESGEESFFIAADLLRMRLDHDRGDLETWQHLARSHYLRGDLARAEQALREGMAAVVRPQRLRVDLIRLLAGAGRGPGVIEELDIHLGEHPRDAEMWHLYVYLLESSGRSDDALAAARTMHERVPDDPRAWSNLGVALARRGRFDAAAEVLRAGATRFPADPTLRENLARVEEVLR
jgi:hypothetical protein